MPIYETAYKDVRAVALENDSLRAVFLPEYGGKMASLVLKRTSREFLVQAPGERYKKLDYTGEYTDAECSGFDDMFPTVDPYYASPPWESVRLPDHGEACRLQWQWEIHEDCLCMAVGGVRLPYRLEKRVSFCAPDSLQIDYRAVNLCGFDMDFLWAAHPMLNAEEGGEILVPVDQGCETFCMFSSGSAKFGDVVRWPELQLGGMRKDMSRTTMRHGPFTYKHYFNSPLPEGWCAYRYPSDNTTLKLSFPRDKVPYLGIWVSEGGFRGLFTLAPEACTGALDRPDIARMRGMHSVIKANGEYDWHFQLTVI